MRQAWIAIIILRICADPACTVEIILPDRAVIERREEREEPTRELRRWRQYNPGAVEEEGE